MKFHYFLNDDISELKTSFQDGCNAIYDACADNGVTPDSNSPEDIVKAIEKIKTQGAKVQIYDITVDTDPATNVGGGKIDIKNDFQDYKTMTNSNFKIGIQSNACTITNNGSHSYVRTSLEYDSNTGIITWNSWCQGNVSWYQNIGFIIAWL